MHFEVVVAGGGSAGLAAAISAARSGARTLLIERHGCLGGMAPAALVHSICGLYRLPVADSAPVFANGGFAREFAERLIARGGAHGPLRMGRVDVLLQHPTAFACLADVIATETPNLTVRLHTEITAVAPDFGSLEINCRGRSDRVAAECLIDCTGDGTLAALGGAACEQESAERLQRPAFIFALGGVDANAADDEQRLKIAGQIAVGVRDGALAPGHLGAALRASGRGSEVFVTIDLAGGAAFNPNDPECLTALELDGRKLAETLATFLRANVAGFAASFLSALPMRVGVRESRRIAGRYRLEEFDLLRGAEFEDSVALAAWPIELRETNRGPRLRYPEEGRPCGIPLRALRARDHARLFMAGRCISCSHEAQASIRVIGTCLATGEAAGFAAALQVSGRDANAEAVNAAREQIAR
ncbi:MAG TPA: FAD-dependent oxidoreductase [Chthoniobacteraceae bacterium]|nr:FAD-dependent oxidoreductase [Chthoniobacteraceae bacterium]